MKKKLPSLILRIPEPCTEDWSNMTPTENGHYCRSCSRELIDFTDFSDRELVAHLQQQEGKLCGIFSRQQLNRNLMPDPVFRPSFQQLSLPALALLAMTMTTQIAYGQAPDTVRTEIISTSVPIPVPTIAPHAPGTDTVSGKVCRGFSQPLNRVKVVLMSGDTVLQTTMTDAEGNFEFLLLSGESADKIRFQKHNYYQRNIDLKDGKNYLNEPLEVYMRKELSRRQQRKRRSVMGYFYF